MPRASILSFKDVQVVTEMTHVKIIKWDLK